MAITNKIGAPVTGEDFYGRKEEIGKIHRYLDECQSLLLSAPRRIGKTSLAKRLITDKKAQKWKCVYIDLQGIATQETFLRALIESLSQNGVMEKTGKKVKDFLDWTFNATEGIDFGVLKIDLRHRNQLEMLYNRLSETFNYSQDTLIVIDELPLFLGKLMSEERSSKGEVEFLLNWFRSIRQNENSRLRWIFCGSVGLRNFANHHRLSHAINDLVEFELGELSMTEAQGLMKALTQAYSIKISDRVIVHSLNLLNWPIPYFIQLLIDRLIAKRVQLGAEGVSVEHIQSALEELSESDYFMTWDERLAEYRDLEKMARQLLDSISMEAEGLTRNQLQSLVMNGCDVTEESDVKKTLTKVLEMLEHDGYLMRAETSKRKFRSPLLRKWWHHKFIE